MDARSAFRWLGLGVYPKPHPNNETNSKSWEMVKAFTGMSWTKTSARGECCMECPRIAHDAQLIRATKKRLLRLGASNW
jgi:hypothetical protein